MNPKTRHKVLLESKKVRRWYENLEARSQVTANVYLRNLGLWLEYLDKDPESIIEFAKDDFEEFKGSVSDQIRKMEKERKQGSYISTSIKPMISYLKFHNVVVKLSLNIKNENRNFNAEQERIPEKFQLRSVLMKSSKREMTAISLMAFSGLRPEVMGNDDGSDGLRLKDIPDLSLNGEIDIKDPAKIEIRAELSKIRLPYFTFLGKEGCDYLRDYLIQRKENGEVLSSESPVILPIIEKSQKESPNEFLTTVLLARRIKRSIRKAGFDWRPYIFRAYFGTNLDTAEAKGFISHSQRQFIMGHKGDIEEVYTKRQSDVKVDEIRSAYAKSLQFLETESKGISEKDSVRLFRESTISAIEIYADVKLSSEERENLLSLSVDEFNEELRKIAKKSKADEMNNGNSHKIVSEKDLVSYLDKGWKLIQYNPRGDKAVIELSD